MESSVFTGVDDSKIQLDFDFLEDKFEYKKASKVVASQPKVQVKQSKLRLDRQRNVEIVLCRLKISTSAICQGLISCSLRD